MKKFVVCGLSFVVVLALFSCGNDKPKVKPKADVESDSTQMAKDLVQTKKDSGLINDTVFIVRERSKGEYHAIFVDPDKNSPYYDKISNFEINNEYQELDNYTANCKGLYEKKKRKKYSLGDIPRNWNHLCVYKGRYYVYVPNDMGGNVRERITDSTMITYLMDGPYPNLITGIKKESPSEYKIGLYPPSNLSPDLPERKVQLTIHIIDLDRGMAVWETKEADEEPEYKLMVDASKIKAFPIIVNYSRNKWIEFDFFDKVDAKKLLKK